MPLRLYDTMARTKEVFEPREAGRVGMYTCGPTIYNYAHIGNFRAYVFEDLLRRYLEFRGYEVRHVMNLTDVEDKLIRTCRETGESLDAVTARYAKAFFEDLDALGIRRAHEYPAATAHIDEMVALIQRLTEKGHTYEDDGSIYFKIASFPEYGRLSHMDIEQLRDGASGRVDSDEYDADTARDFVLWKRWVPQDGEVYWETALGKGRPGWHIECSAMAMKYLGESFDLHCGGVDNIFPHHENEIAQSQCATGQRFAKYWLHCAHLVVDNKKMSKSLGNFYTLRDLEERGADLRAVRWVLIATHYRQPNNFSFDALEAATQALRRIADFRIRLEECKGSAGCLEDTCRACGDAFIAAMDDDLNISGGLAAVFDFVREINARLDAGEIGQDAARKALALLDRLDSVTGLFSAREAEGPPGEIIERVNARQAARRAKNFAEADQIRDALAADGWIVEDTPAGPRVKRG